MLDDVNVPRKPTELQRFARDIIDEQGRKFPTVGLNATPQAADIPILGANVVRNRAAGNFFPEGIPPSSMISEVFPGNRFLDGPLLYTNEWDKDTISHEMSHKGVFESPPPAPDAPKPRLRPEDYTRLLDDMKTAGRDPEVDKWFSTHRDPPLKRTATELLKDPEIIMDLIRIQRRADEENQRRGRPKSLNHYPKTK